MTAHPPARSTPKNASTHAARRDQQRHPSPSQRRFPGEERTGDAARPLLQLRVPVDPFVVDDGGVPLARERDEPSEEGDEGDAGVLMRRRSD